MSLTAAAAVIEQFVSRSMGGPEELGLELQQALSLALALIAEGVATQAALDAWADAREGEALARELCSYPEALEECPW
jgi:hypothetical protein